MRKLLLPLIVVGSLLATPELKASEPVLDQTLVTDLAKAYLSAYFRRHPKHGFELDFEQPVILTATDGNGRSFIFVSYHTTIDSNDGASIVFEHCGTHEIYPSHYGAVPDIRKEVEWFKAVQDDQTADFPGQCPSSE